MSITQGSQTTTAQQIVRSGVFTLACNAETAFPLFSPEGERQWIRDWNPRPIFPEKILFQPDTVFSQGEGAEEAIWTIVDADSQCHRAEYVRVAPKSHAAHVIVKIDPSGPQRCDVAVSYTITVFGEHSSFLLEQFCEDGYAAKMRTWQHQISDYLSGHQRR